MNKWVILFAWKMAINILQKTNLIERYYILKIEA